MAILAAWAASCPYCAEHLCATKGCDADVASFRPAVAGSDALFSGRVTRFDLAPTPVASIAEAYEGIFTPVTPEPAPHVTWRFAFMTDKFMGAGPVVVGRRILDNFEHSAKKWTPKPRKTKAAPKRL